MSADGVPIEEIARLVGHNRAAAELVCSTLTTSLQVVVTGFPTGSRQETAVQGTVLANLALAWLSAKAFWLAPPETAGTHASL